MLKHGRPRRWHLSQQSPGDEPTSRLGGPETTPLSASDSGTGTADGGGRSNPPTGGDEPPPKPPGLFGQFKRTRDAALRFVKAHVDLAKAEFSEIADKAKAAAAKVAGALGLAIYLGMLLPVGGTLFVGEWLFGSIGWGLLHGALMAIALIVILLLAALEISTGKLARAFVWALLLGILTAVLLAPALPNRLYVSIGDSMLGPVDPAFRYILVGLALGAIVGAVLGFLFGARLGGFRGAIGGLILGVILFALLGWFLAITFRIRVGIALGIAVTLVAWPALAARNLRGFDFEKLKNGYIPRATIDTTKESIEWVRGLTQRSKKS